MITGEDLVAAKLGWLPTFHGFDNQMVLAIGKALFQYQEVAGVIATSREIAADGAELVDVQYEPLDPVVDPYQSKLDKIILRDDREAKTNHIYHWEVGEREKTDAATRRVGRHDQGTHSLAALPSGAARTVRLRLRYERRDRPA